MTYTLNGEQLEGMGSALTTGGSSLLHIGIQIMPYAIAMTIILIIFALVKNWSKLKQGFASIRENRRWKKFKKDLRNKELEEIAKYRTRSEKAWYDFNNSPTIYKGK